MAELQHKQNILWIPAAILLIGCGLLGGGRIWNSLGNRYDPSLTLQAQAQKSIVHTPLGAEQMPASIYWDISIPLEFSQHMVSPGKLSRVNDPNLAIFTLSQEPSAVAGMQVLDEFHMVFVLVAPFATISDDINFKELQGYWFGKHVPDFSHLIVPQESMGYLVSEWGQPAAGQVRVLSAGEVVSPWAENDAWALIPFERLSPEWKVITIDGMSPLLPAMKEVDYPLTISYYISGRADSMQLWAQTRPNIPLKSSNRDTNRMARVIMTGVTALVRATADRMETKGMLYPARDIGGLLRDADITHISNEVAFNESCPLPDPYTVSLRFCSRPAYLELLVDVSADVIELTGNHMNDWHGVGNDVTFSLYRDHGMAFYGGGIDLDNSQEPALFDINGNQIAFIGCNDPGPDFDWATPTQGGSAPCGDYSWMIQSIQELSAAGYQVIATVQYHENYTYLASPQEREIYRSLAEAGAIVIQGSQAHTPKEMEFFGNAFIHYGLGNLFFDQMHYTEGGKVIRATREEFIDRYTFLDNRLISIELLTAMLEDYARPRPMTESERNSLLETVFSASMWGTGE